MEHIGFVGVGSMGKPMAANLMKAGWKLTVVAHRNRSPVDELESLGAEVAVDLPSLAGATDVLITMLPADREITEVYDLMLPHLKAGALCLDLTSARPDTIAVVAQKAASRKIEVVDGSVSGGVSRATEGKLTIMVGGRGESIERVRPILDALGSQVYVTGGVGSAKAVKIINQFLNAAHTAVASEALCLARSMGIDLETLTQVVAQSSGASWVFANKVPAFIIPERFKPGFRLELMTKDLGLAIGFAAEHNLTLPIGSLVDGEYREMMEQGHAAEDYTVVSRWIAAKNAKAPE